MSQKPQFQSGENPADETAKPTRQKADESEHRGQILWTLLVITGIFVVAVQQFLRNTDVYDVVHNDAFSSALSKEVNRSSALLTEPRPLLQSPQSGGSAESPESAESKSEGHDRNSSQATESKMISASEWL